MICTATTWACWPERAPPARRCWTKFRPCRGNRLDINGPVRLGRATRLWQTFIRMHRALRDDHEGMEALLLQDFARAYEMQGRTLNPLGARPKQGAQQ